MAVEDFQSYMRVLADEQSLDWITFHGGEPFLFYKTLRRCIEIAHKLGQKEIAVITNGYWGGNQTNAQTKLRELKKAGLTSVFFSVDAFHQEHVPFRSVHTAVNVARTVDFEKLTVSSCYLGSVDSDNFFNRKTEEYLERLKLPDDFRIDKHSLDVQGRATDTLTSNLKRRAGIPQGKCVLPYWAGETLKDPKVIEIDHMSNRTVNKALDIIWEAKYPGVVATHGRITDLYPPDANTYEQLDIPHPFRSAEQVIDVDRRVIAQKIVVE